MAANQIGILRRLIVIDIGSGLLKLVNPRIISSAGTQLAEEGCLSFPGVWGKVHRPAKMTVAAHNEWGEPITVAGDGLPAQCLSHEIDHLDSIVFTDKIHERIDVK